MEKAPPTSTQHSTASRSRLQQTAGNAATVQALRSSGIPTVAWQGEASGERFLFMRGSTELLSGQQEALRAFARTLPPDFRFVLHGMASEEGPAAFNERLAQARAERAVELLAEAGLSPSRIDVIVVHGEVPGDRRSHRAVVIDIAPQVSTEPPPRKGETPVPGVPSVVSTIAEAVPSELGVKYDDEVVSSYRPLGPVLYRFKLKFSLSGTVKGPWHGTKALFAIGKMKTEFSKSFSSELGKLSLKFDTGGKIGAEWTTKSRLDLLLGGRPVLEVSSPIVEAITGKASAKKLDFVDFGGGAAWEDDLSNWVPPDFRSSLGLPEGITFPGKISAKFAVGVVPNPVWVARGAAAAASTEVVAGATALEVASGVALPLGMIAFVGYGVYQLNESHERGRVYGMRLAFAQGYAEALLALTESAPRLPRAAELLELDAGATFAAAVNSARRSSGPAFAESSAAREAGRAAAAQAVDALVERDPEGFGAWRQRMRTRYGIRESDRGYQFRALLNAQAKGEGPMGIDLEI